jgi:hypothetical protein
MKKILLLALIFATQLLSAQNFWTPVNYKGAFPVTDGTSATDWTYSWSNFDPENTVYPATATVISSDITSNTTISGTVLLQNKVYVTNNANLTILPGTIIRGDYSTQGTLIITRGSKIFAEGTVNSPIVFTSNEPIGNRTEGDWGGLVILGRGVNNQPGGMANIEGIPATSLTQYGGTDDMDNSGVLKYVRIEFAGIPLEPNKEINGLTMGSVGSGTSVDFVQVSFSGDDSFEWFGGTVNCKHLISYRGIDDDFDTDFGFRGKVQFALSIRDNTKSDAPGDSNGFESDNDATGSVSLPKTAPVFSNVTLVGPMSNGSVSLPTGEKFEKAFRIRRNSSISIYNSIATGWEKGLSIEGTATEANFNNGEATFKNNVISNVTNPIVTFQYSQFSNNNNDSTLTLSDINWVDIFTSLGSTPDSRLNNTSVVSTGADFTDLGSATSTISIEEKNISIYPNPSNGIFNITGYDEMLIVITDLTGRTLLTKQINKNNQIDLSNLSSGIYFITINNQETKKLVLN